MIYFFSYIMMYTIRIIISIIGIIDSIVTIQLHK
jgi:hypothetical protein